MRRADRALRAGVAAVEFALLAPVLVLLLAGTAEVALALRAAARLDRTAGEVANLLSQQERVATADVAALFDAAREIARPLAAWQQAAEANARARTAIGVVRGTPQGNVPAWTCLRGDASLTPRVAGSPVLPAGLVLAPGQTIVVVEVISTPGPWTLFPGAAFIPGTASIIHAHAVLRPRLASLDALQGGCPA
jgi:Flp pilus assembly protein TadG